jgi:hypothetical protein
MSSKRTSGDVSIGMSVSASGACQSAHAATAIRFSISKCWSASSSGPILPIEEDDVVDLSMPQVLGAAAFLRHQSSEPVGATHARPRTSQSAQGPCPSALSLLLDSFPFLPVGRTANSLSLGPCVDVVAERAPVEPPTPRRDLHLSTASPRTASARHPVLPEVRSTVATRPHVEGVPPGPGPGTCLGRRTSAPAPATFPPACPTSGAPAYTRQSPELQLVAVPGLVHVSLGVSPDQALGTVCPTV